MRGIAGVVVSSFTERHREALQRMTNALAHRGPDGEGHHVFPNSGLGHRRLAVVDIGGRAQPMLSGDSRVAVTFNLEIYGYQDFQRLITDYPFQTRSDTEVILAFNQRAVARELRIMGLSYGRRYSSVLAAHQGQMSQFEQRDLEQLEIAEGRSARVPEIADLSGSMDDVLRFDVGDYMPADILTKIDRASISNP